VSEQGGKKKASHAFVLRKRENKKKASHAFVLRKRKKQEKSISRIRIML
jgi:hypothetical protein